MTKEEQIETLSVLREAEELLRVAHHASFKLRLQGEGHNIGLPDETRMFSLDFSPKAPFEDSEVFSTGSGRYDALRPRLHGVMIALKRSI